VVLATSHLAWPDRRPLGYYRIAQALGLHSVLQAESRLLGVGELAELLRAEPVTLESVRQKAIVSNDGRVRALWQEQCSGRELLATEAPEIQQWAKLGASHDPIDAATSALVRGYVEMVVLDFLTGNVARRSLWLDAQARSVCLGGEQGAFPGFLAPKTVDFLFEPVRPLVRFPRGLDEALRRLDRAQAQALLQNGGFEQWLVGPRDITDLLERKATLQTLLEARVSKAGRDATFSLGP